MGTYNVRVFPSDLATKLKLPATWVVANVAHEELSKEIDVKFLEGKYKDKEATVSTCKDAIVATNANHAMAGVVRTI